MKVLVTGGAGFIGSHVVRALVTRGNEVSVCDDFNTGLLENLRGPDFNGLLHWKPIQKLNRADVYNPPDAIVHLAAIPSVQRSTEQPNDTFDANVGGTFAALALAREWGCRRFVFASSSSVYGQAGAGAREVSEWSLTEPMSPYACHKLMGEHLCEDFRGLFGVPTCALRFFNVYGPRQRADSDYAAVVPRFLTALSKGERPVVYGDGLQSRAFTYVGDVAEAVLVALDYEGSGVRCLNVAAGEVWTVHDLLYVCANVVGVPAENVDIDRQPSRTGEVRYSRPNVGRIERALGWRARTKLVDGLRLTYDWMRHGVPKDWSKA